MCTNLIAFTQTPCLAYKIATETDPVREKIATLAAIKLILSADKHDYSFFDTKNLTIRAHSDRSVYAFDIVDQQ